MTAADLTWDGQIQALRDFNKTDAGRAYVALVETARPRWEAALTIYSWRVDVLNLRPRQPSGLVVQVEHRVHDGQ